jgi:thioredoxin reductase
MYDVIIIGAGSAGYPAGMYASRYKLKNIII